MLDCFSLLNEPRRPWLDPEPLKQKFLARSAEIHPDRTHSAAGSAQAESTRRFAELNAAWQCLREPKDRLGHLLELETGARPKDTRDIPESTIELFFEVGRLCREADSFLALKAKTESPLLKAEMFAPGMDMTDRLDALQRRITARREELTEELKQLNAVWQSAPEPGNPSRTAALPLEKLEAVYRMFSYIARWTAQIQERTVQLSF
jgi:DnaJ-domain-containing protein 1